MKRRMNSGVPILRVIARFGDALGGVRRAAKWALLLVLSAGPALLCLGQYKPGTFPIKIVQLPEPKLTGPLSLEQVLAKPQSVQQFAGRPLGFVQIGQLAWAGQGVMEPPRALRTPPSATGIGPMSLYFVTDKGFLYRPEQHSLEQVIDQDIRERLAAAALKQRVVADAPCDIVVAGTVRKLASKYGNKARRYMLLEAGRIAQNIQLQAASLELGSVPVVVFDSAQVRKVCTIPTTLEPLYIICVGYPAEQVITERAEEKNQSRTIGKTGTMRAALIVARENFRDEELFETRLELERATVETVVASTRTGPVKGMLGGMAEAAILVNGLRVDDYDAIIFVGGPGATEYFDNPIALNIARQAAYRGKVLAAICIAPAVLANAGVLGGIRATSFWSERDRLQNAGAIYTGAPVERDGLIITASDPRAARQFGRAIAQTLTGRQ